VCDTFFETKVMKKMTRHILQRMTVLSAAMGISQDTQLLCIQLS
jgi:hypothetical protein